MEHVWYVYAYLCWFVGPVCPYSLLYCDCQAQKHIIPLNCDK
uniref:Uncharacterized protein n=1 Tax=Arundo donax TaxID=35708 RepID=A0A0A8ZC21_ARUDO